MCISSSDWIQSHNLYISMHKQRSKRSKVQVQGLITRFSSFNEEKSDGEKDITVMILQNLKLYMENMSILQENERLRKKASLLHTENLTLMYELSSNRYFLASSSTNTQLCNHLS
nr:protein LITTLE ZIPPER 1-like [Ipomoea batatas]